MLELAVFDLDGTLVRTIGDLAGALNHALAENGLPTLTQERVEAIVGYSTAYMFAHAVPEGREDAVANVGKIYDEYYSRHCCDRSLPYEGMLQAINELRAAGVRLAVVTNKPHKDALTVIETLFPKDTFSLILGRMDRFATKPDPEPLRFALDFLGVSPENAAYVGDSEVDVRFAGNAGIRCVSVGWGYRSRQTLLDAGATVILDKAEQLPAALLRP